MSKPQLIPATPPRRSGNLIVVRAGDESLHQSWIAGADRDFDILVSYYGDKRDLWREGADYYEVRRGPKWPCLGELFSEQPELIDRYEVFWFPDDDLAATTDNINRMFSLFRGFSLALAQPALTPDSYYAWKQTLQKPCCTMRYVGFIEVMAPIFNRHALRACLDTFFKSRSGWGLDFVWPRLVGRGRRDSIAIIDATPVRHTRPLGGDLYRSNPDLNPKLELLRIIESHNLEIDRRFSRHVLYGVLSVRKPNIICRMYLYIRLRFAKLRSRSKFSTS